MIGITNFDLRKHKDILEGFFGLAINGNVPPKNEPGHLDGWGIGYYKNNKPRVIKSGGSVVKESKRFFGSLKRIKSSKILIVHFRKSAWDKTSKKQHAHPFYFKNFIFAHNGTLYDYKKLLDSIPRSFQPAPSALDTEVFFRFLLEGFPGSFNSKVKTAAKLSKFSAMNFIMSDGSKLYAYRRFSKWADYYTFYTAKSGNSCIVSSEKVSPKLSWSLLRVNNLLTIG